MRLLSGKPYPLGATYDGEGVNFSLFSSIADKVELCLFSDDGSEQRFELRELTNSCWHAYIRNLSPGQKYGYRVRGPWAPEAGLRCNPAKLLLDPYAKCIQGSVSWNEAVFPHNWLGPSSVRNDIDSAPYVPRSVVTDTSFNWGADSPPRTPWPATVIYEVHVKGFTALHPEIPKGIRGTFRALAHPQVIKHFKTLGVTTIELMPVQQFVNEMHLCEQGLKNYWGYNTIGFFAPHNEYATSDCETRGVAEFKAMVKALHEAGLEVILDVVYGHTPEGNHLGPVFSFKGIDNPAYYRLDEPAPYYYKDYTGTGNSLDMRQPQVLQLLMDSLRYWIQEMHVDGFRFDLAPTLARGASGVERWCAFFNVVQQDPVVNQAKLIAEPWDASAGGYQVGNFPQIWSEWNGKFRDGVRDYWRGTNGSLQEFALRFSGSPDLYAGGGRRPRASINFVTCHDGFTLEDLVSYNEKHNTANGECNRDGENDNRSWNCGIEGDSDDPAIVGLRSNQKRNLLATLLLSQGVPMLLAGDELGRTQRGNNNPYCQDNELSWIDWEHADLDLMSMVVRLLTLRRRNRIFRRPAYLGERIQWYRNDGERMIDGDWETPWAKAAAVFLSASGIVPSNHDQYLAFNPHSESLPFVIPHQLGWGWRFLLCTAGRGSVPAFSGARGLLFQVEPYSLIVASRSLTSD